MKRLEGLRRRLDRADRRLLELLAERLEVVREVAALKVEGLPFLRDHEREGELLERVEGWARELGLDPYRARGIFREIIAMSLAEQEEALRAARRERAVRATVHRAAYQGIEGSYSHQAAQKYFGVRAASMELVGCSSFAEALGMVERGEAGFALLPVENTTAGSINQTYELLRETSLAIVGEEILAVRHCLLAVEEVAPHRLRQVISHPQALAQCSRFLASLDGVDVRAWEDTAGAAREVARRGDPALGAVAGESAARRFGLTVIARDIANQRENWTRFLIVSAPQPPPDPRIPSKTSLILTTRHHQGALAEVLSCVASHGLNLCKLESRPEPRRPWEYMFYVDMEGSLAAEPVTLAVAELRRLCPYLKVLGSYPARTTRDGFRDRPQEGEPGAFAGGGSPVGP